MVSSHICIRYREEIYEDDGLLWHRQKRWCSRHGDGDGDGVNNVPIYNVRVIERK